MEMEGSMKIMSWSRYRCLSWSLMRIRSNRKPRYQWRAGADPGIGLRAKTPGRAMRADIAAPEVSSPGVSDS
jgi:hypothetical protein